MDATIRHDPDLLSRLRAHLRAEGLYAFLVPHADAHQSEYLAPADERLARVSGFTGSAGFAIVAEDAAALFVDGRYTLQAANEVDGKVFEVHHGAQIRPVDWLKPRLKRGVKIGYDAWLHTSAGLEEFIKACTDAGAEMASLAANPIDALWPDRPPAPASPIEALLPPYAPLSSKAKRGQISGIIKSLGADAVILTAGDSLAWLFNIRACDVPYTPLVLAFAILDASGKAELFIKEGRLNAEGRAHLGNNVRILPPDALGPALDALGRSGRSVLVPAETTAAWIAERLARSGARIIGGDDPCQLPKACKTPAEIEGIRRAHVRDGAAVARFLAWLDASASSGEMTELAAAQHLDALRAADTLARGPSFPTISGAGPNGAIVHYRVTEGSDRALKQGELYLVDSGGQYLDGTTDVTRTVAIGQPTAEMKDRFTRVLKGHIAITRQVFPKGTRGQELDVLARRALWEAGLDYDHGTGHGVGTYLSVHEGPQRIAKRGNGAELAVGMVLSNEPGYYKAGAFGIRIENLITVVSRPTPKGGEREMLGFEPLTLVPIDLRLVDAALLSAEDARWLDTYHARVREALSPLLDTQAQAWLGRATRAITPSH